MEVNPRQLITALALCATTSCAHAGVLAQSILGIDNLRLLRANGNAYAIASGSISGTYGAAADANLNGASAEDTYAVVMHSNYRPDLAPQQVGNPGMVDNDFTPFGLAVVEAFSHADQAMSGGIISYKGSTAGASMQTRAASGAAGNTVADGTANAGMTIRFRFQLASADTMTVSFDARPYAQSWIGDDATEMASAGAQLGWSAEIVNMGTGVAALWFAPEALNMDSAMMRTGEAAGVSTYDPGTMSFSATSALLAAGTNYELIVRQYTEVTAFEAATVPVPEPASLAILGIGLLGLVTCRRRSGAA